MRSSGLWRNGVEEKSACGAEPKGRLERSIIRRHSRHARFDTQKDAVSFAKTQARKESAEFYVHRRDGTIQERDS
jgi:hypothetical protein